MKNLIIALLGLFNLSGFAQLSITPTDASTAVNTLIGSNANSIQIIGTPTFSGNSNQLGTFSFTGSVIGMNSGIFIGTNGYDLITGGNLSNNSTGIGSDTPNPSTNADLTSLLSQYYSTLPAPQPSPPSTFHNLACLEFKAKILSSSAKFTFVFASEEYSSYVASPFNDIFAFLVSGPGINGNINGFANIALVPGTSTPIMVSTVNDGYTGVPSSNSQYFKNNTLLSEYPSPPNSPCCISTFQMDGFTINPFSSSGNLEAEINNLECGAEYTFKFYIANVSDNMLISSVFLKEGSFVGSFSAGPVSVTPSPICLGQQVILQCQGNIWYEYEWFTANGTSIGEGQMITTIASQLDLPYYVIVTDPASGCSQEFTVEPTFNNPANQPPYTKGINDLGLYYWTAAANEHNCIRISTYDDWAEDVFISFANLPSGFVVDIQDYTTPENKFQQYANVCWEANLDNLGVHCFNVISTDLNNCDEPDNSTTIEEYCINIICPGCTPDVYYQNRTAANNPVPPLTESAGFIAVGNSVTPYQNNGPVVISSQTMMRASSYIFLEDGFSTNGNIEFIAEIKTPECAKDCNFCCKEFSGFPNELTGIFIPNVFTPNGDGVNDVWCIYDTLNPSCPFWGAEGYKLAIRHEGNTTAEDCVAHDEQDAYFIEHHWGVCCALKSPPMSSPFFDDYIIGWDGIWNVQLSPCRGKIVPSNYRVELTLFNCGFSKTYQLFPIGNQYLVVNN